MSLDLKVPPTEICRECHLPYSEHDVTGEAWGHTFVLSAARFDALAFIASLPKPSR